VAKRIYVGSLPYSTMEEQLASLFRAYGNVTDTHVVIDRATGQSRGFAFVEMENDAEADAAINALNGSTFEGRTLVVNEARPREERSGGGGRFGGGRDRDRRGGGGGRRDRW
jgi:RNA recognition motif-containing protein